MATNVAHLGCPGHLIVASSCRWRRHTQIGDKYRVSSVGDYFPEKGKPRDTIGVGPDDYFETMVFRTNPNPEAGSEGCGCLDVQDYSEIDGKRYATAGDAQRGHDTMVEKYRAIADGERDAD